MKSFEKTNRSLKELWGIVDGLADNRSPCFLVGKNGKARNLVSIPKNQRKPKKVNSFNC